MKKITNLEYLSEVVRGGDLSQYETHFRYPPAIAKTLGFQLLEVGVGTASIEMQTKTDAHANPMGTIHGGVLCDIADASIGMAHVTTLAEGESFTTVDLQVNFFRPIWNELIRASARPIHLGKTVSRYVCDVTKADGKLVAQVLSSVITLRGDSAKDR